MPAYEEQLAAYRAQLANIASMQAQQPSGGNPSLMATTGLAFNAMMSDMASMASLTRSFPMVPSASSVARVEGPQYHQMGLFESMTALTGFRTPKSPMYINDYQYLAGQRLSQAAENFTTGLVTGGIGLGGSIGLGIAGGAAGAAIGSLILPGVGTAVGGFLGSMAGSYVGDALTGPIIQPVQEIQRTTANLRATTPAIFGGMGLSKELSRSMARDINQIAMERSGSIFANPGDEVNLMNMAITQGTRYGLFSGTTDSASFKKELTDLTKTIKDMSNAIRVSKEEMIPILSEMRQGGFYGAKAGGQAILATSGLAFGAGVGFQEMHEMGLRGAAIFRGTGVPIAAGYTIAEQSLFNVKRMQQMGIISPEAINQLGGVTGAAEKLTVGAAGFTQGSFGRATAAMLMQGRGGINQEAFASLASGQSISQILTSANIDVAAVSNPLNVQRFWQNLGPEGIQRAQAGMLRSLTREIMPVAGNYEDAFAMVFRRMAPEMGVEYNADTLSQWQGYTQNLPSLMAAQRRNVREERRRAAEDQMVRRYDIWENIGVRPASRAFRRAVRPVYEGITTMGEEIGDATEAVTDWVMNRRRVREAEGELTWALKVGGAEAGKGVRRTGGDLSRADFEIMKNLGMTGYGGTYTYKPSRTEKSIQLTSGTSEAWMNEYRQLVGGIREGASYKFSDADDRMSSFMGENISLILKTYNTQMGADFKMGDHDFQKFITEVQQGSTDRDVQTKIVGLAKAAETVARDHGFKDASSAQIQGVFGAAVYGKAGRISAAEALADANTSGVAFNVKETEDKADHYYEIIMEDKLGLGTKGRSYLFGKPSVWEREKNKRALEDPEFQGMLAKYLNKEKGVEWGDLVKYVKKAGIDIDLTKLRTIREDPKKAADAVAGLKKYQGVLSDKIVAKHMENVVAPYFKKIMDEGHLGDAEKFKDNLLYKASKAISEGKEIGTNIETIVEELYKPESKDLEALRTGGATSRGLAFFGDIRERAAQMAAEKGEQVTKSHIRAAAQLVIGEMQGKREGIESGNASERAAARSMAFKDPVQQKQYETMNLLFTAVKGLTERVENIKK